MTVLFAGIAAGLGQQPPSEGAEIYTQMADADFDNNAGEASEKMSRYTQPDKPQQLLLAQLQLVLPPQPPPEITGKQIKSSCGEDL